MNALSCACIRVRAYKLLPSDHRKRAATATGKARAVKGIQAISVVCIFFARSLHGIITHNLLYTQFQKGAKIILFGGIFPALHRQVLSPF